MRTTRSIRPSHVRRAFAATALGLTLAVTTVACGDDDGGDTSSAVQPSATEHNDADVAFATDMLQHHAQAVVMVNMTNGRTLDPEVQALADQIRDAQVPEIETFKGWLTDWDEPVPATMNDHVNGGHGGDTTAAESMEGMGDSSMPGMMSADDMTALESAPDAEFQTMWLEMMTEHHTGALDMAETETADGQYRPAIDLANSIIASQTEEIATMEDLLSARRRAR